MQVRRSLLPVVGLALVLALVGAACGGGEPEARTVVPKQKTPAVSLATSRTADLRVGLGGLLQEHVYLAAFATQDALAAQTGASAGASASLDDSSVALSKQIGLVYGADAEKTFLSLWRSHIQLLVDYASNVGKRTLQNRAIQNLRRYVQNFADFVVSINPKLTAQAVADLVDEHVSTLRAVIDLQAKKAYSQAQTALKKAIAHVGVLSRSLSIAISSQFPSKFPGNIEAASIRLRVRLSELLADFAFLSARAGVDSVSGQAKALDAVNARLEVNAGEIADEIGAYAADVRDDVLAQFRSAIRAARTLATATGATAQKAKADLEESLTQISVKVATSIPTINRDALARSLKNVAAAIARFADQVRQKSFEQAYATLRAAGDDIGAVSTSLTTAIIQQFPSKFPA